MFPQKELNEYEKQLVIDHYEMLHTEDAKMKTGRIFNNLDFIFLLIKFHLCKNGTVGGNFISDDLAAHKFLGWRCVTCNKGLYVPLTIIKERMFHLSDTRAKLLHTHDGRKELATLVCQ